MTRPSLKPAPRCSFRRALLLLAALAAISGSGRGAWPNPGMAPDDGSHPTSRSDDAHDVAVQRGELPDCGPAARLTSSGLALPPLLGWQPIGLIDLQQPRPDRSAPPRPVALSAGLDARTAPPGLDSRLQV